MQCEHTFCTECITRWAELRKSLKKKVNCPLCKQRVVEIVSMNPIPASSSIPAPAESEAYTITRNRKRQREENEVQCLKAELAREREERAALETRLKQIGQCGGCGAAPATHVVMPCGHHCLCQQCAEAMGVAGSRKECPRCARKVQRVVKLYM